MSVGGASAAGGAGASASSSASTGTSTTSSTTGTGATGATTSSGATGTTTSGTTGTTAAPGTTGQTNAANGSTVNGQTDASNGPAATPNATAPGPAAPPGLTAQFNAAIEAAKQTMAQTADKGEPGMRGIAPAAEQQAKALAQQQPKVQLAQIIAAPVPAAPPVAIPNTPAKKPASEAIANKIMNAVEGLFAPNEAPVTDKPLAAIPAERHLEEQPLTPLPAVPQYPWADSFDPLDAAPPVTPMTAAKVDGINGPIGFPGTPLPPVQPPGTPAQEPTKPEAIGGGFQSPTLDGLNTETLTHPAIDNTLPGYETPDMPVDMTILAAKPGVKLSDPHPSWTKPTGPLDGKPIGELETIFRNADEATKRGIRAQNDALNRLAGEGYQVISKPAQTLGPDGKPYLTREMKAALGLDKNKNPDAVIEGRIFDVYAPKSETVKGVYDGIVNKVSEDQAHRIVVDLRDTDISPRALRDYLHDNEISKLREVILIDQDGRIRNFFPFKN
jgi:Contact-dependent growth inhibition CdiA C-terminal domain